MSGPGAKVIDLTLEVDSAPATVDRTPSVEDSGDDWTPPIRGRLQSDPARGMASASALQVGSADDKHEQEADVVANRVIAALRRRAGRDPAGEAMVSVQPVASLAILRRQAKGSGTVGRAGGALPNHVHDRLTSALGDGRPLASNVRSDFEQAIGADLSSVRVHSGPVASELNSRLGARAFTVGQDIFFAGGLPDVSTEDGQHLLGHELAHTLSAAGPVRRLVATQLAVRKDDGDVVRITRIVIAGRPPPTFGSSMGDHSTAFTVHDNAVRLALVGYPLDEAVARLDDLLSGIGALPGFALVADLPPRQAGMWAAAQSTIAAIHHRLHAPPDGLNLVGAVQEYVSAYLELRELIPLSTINTGQVSIGTSGKGKGEDTTSLVAQSHGIDQAPSNLASEILGLLDIRAVALACIEPDASRLPGLAPGLPASAGVDERAKLYVLQHLQTIKTAFPGAIAAQAQVPPTLGPPNDDRFGARTADEKAIPALAQELMVKFVLPYTQACLVDEYPGLKKRFSVLRGEIELLIPPPEAKGVKRKRDPLDTGDTVENRRVLKKKRTDEAEQLFRLNKVEELLGHELTTALPEPEVVIAEAPAPVVGPAPRRTSARTPKLRTTRDASEGQERQDALKFEAAREAEVKTQRKQRLADKDKDRGADLAEELDEADVEAKNDRKSPLGIQVIVADSGTVAEIRSAGRPPSPFPGTMGAHTTAWTVHVDRVRQLIVGLGLADALTAVTVDLARERKETADLLDPAFVLPSGVVPAADLSTADSHDELVLLQDAIVAHLAAINVIAGAALASADTGGKTEAQYRRILLERLGLQQYSRRSIPYSPEVVLSAIVGLLDVSGLEDVPKAKHGIAAELTIIRRKEPLGRLVLHHLRTIEAAYPGALLAAELETPTKVNSRSVGIVSALAQKERGPASFKKPTKVVDEMADDLGSGAPEGVMELDEKAFGPGPTNVSIVDTDRVFTSTFLDGFGSGLDSVRSLHEKPSPQDVQAATWLDAEGNLVEKRLPDFVDAYRADIALPGIRLDGAAAAAIADEFKVVVRVYRDAIPPEFTAIDNVADGDGLIHAISDVASFVRLESGGMDRSAIPSALAPAGKRAADAQVPHVRMRLAAKQTRANVVGVVNELVALEIQGKRPAGIGPAMWKLLGGAGLRHAIEVHHARADDRAAVKALALKQEAKAAKRAERKALLAAKKAKREAAKALAASGAVETAPAIAMSMDIVEESMEIVDPAGVTPVAAPLLIQPAAPPEIYGTGSPLAHYALLHTGKNHYVALIRTG